MSLSWQSILAVVTAGGEVTTFCETTTAFLTIAHCNVAVTAIVPVDTIPALNKYLPLIGAVNIPVPVLYEFVKSKSLVE